MFHDDIDDEDLDPETARSILVRLQAGQPPKPENVRYIMVGREEEMQRLCDKQIEGFPSVKEGNGQMFYVLGDFGYGKSMFLNRLTQEAKDRNFIYSKFDIQDIQDIEHKGNFYEQITSRIQYPDQNGSGLGPLLKQFCEQVGYEEFHDVATEHDMVGHPIYEVLDGLLEAWTKGEVYVERDDETLTSRQVMGGAASYLTGDEVSLARKRPIGRKGLGTILSKEDSKLYGYLKHIISVGSAIGYDGLIVLIDEAAEQMEWSDDTNIDQRLIDLYNKCTHEFGPVMFVFVGNEEKWDWLIDKAAHQALEQRYHQKKVVLDDLKQHHYVELVGKVARVKEIAGDKPIKLSQADAEEIVDEASTVHGGIDSLSPRNLLISPKGRDNPNTTLIDLLNNYEE